MSKDWVSYTFKAMQDRGEDIGIVYAQQISADGEMQWFNLPHNEYDGIGGFNKLLDDAGIEREASPLFKGSRPNWWRYLKGLLAVLPDGGIQQQAWKNFDRSRPNNNAPLHQRIAYDLFSREETESVIAQARSEQVTVNSYLFKHADDAVRHLLLPPGSSTAWVVPVNLRGVVQRHSNSVPHMSFWLMRCTEDDTASSIHQRIRQLKNKYYHYGTWMLFNAGKLVGEKGVVKDLEAKEQGNHSWTGTFSNLGAWNLSDDRPWIFAPNVSRTNPVAVGCVSINGRLGVTVQLHGALGASVASSQAVIDRWKHNCLVNHVEDNGALAAS